jgi:site-specific DNA-methyltransferase (adenine-specific)
MSGQNNSKDKFKWVPVMDFSREWNDFDLYEYFDLSEEEIEHIEKNVK